MFKNKGERGYLSGRKKKNLIIALGLALAILALVLIGFFLNGDTKNIYTIMGVLTALPFANIITVYIALFPFNTPDKQEYEQVYSEAGDGVFLTELVVTSPNLKTIFLSFSVINDGGIIAYSPTPVENIKKYEEYISGMMAASHLQLRVKIYTDFNPFLKSLKKTKIISRNEADSRINEAEAVLKSLSI